MPMFFAPHIELIHIQEAKYGMHCSRVDFNKASGRVPWDFLGSLTSHRTRRFLANARVVCKRVQTRDLRCLNLQADVEGEGDR